MDYFSLAEKMLSVRARLSHLRPGRLSAMPAEASFRAEPAASARSAELPVGAAAQHGGLVGAHCGAFEAP